jgi:hypothetical protein
VINIKQIIAEDSRIIAYFNNITMDINGISADLIIADKKTAKQVTMKLDGVKINLWEVINTVKDVLTGQRKINRNEIFAKTLKTIFGIVDISKQMHKKELKK